MDYNKMALEMHKKLVGKISVTSKAPVNNKDDLSTAYTPGVAEPCRVIHEKPETVYDYTAKSNLIAVVSDGSAVLGLGDIGAAASIPVMEGKCVLFKEFGNVDAFPICLDTKDVDEIVRTVQLMEPVFGGINLEDIAAPRCFEIEEKLKKVTNIPIFHDDQHGTAVVTTAAIINALKITGKKFEDVKAVINGSGAAGNSIAKLLLSMGIKDIFMCDRKGIIYKDREGLDKYKKELSEITNNENRIGSLADAMSGADIFIGVSAPGIVSKEMVASMNEKAIVLPMANPVPEIMPDLAIEAGAMVVGTGRSDFPNQVNNVLAFPGIFRGALDVRASDINEEMKMAAAKALADSVGDKLAVDFILPKAFDEGYSEKVAEAVKKAAIDSGVARI
ncbi:malate dehydrogenase (oxaloacetate-decarboxylating) [Dethiosulfatibacter aminovorans DSM 17477]|uniref:Malate dehydrogenase (Oxaloacetate-decarboxylating) n=1 Tax=Dethiosulfatibacter aminovorans DSM 17477 TaxID=1121476 RepID=A0A1M6J7U2_9FIRM|nr:malic enzyme-like NAD(P)-binding protein [Dethiosulfatibacter aminovorans]SHJ42783.1 malate dehydrogenase (oxaloacetate-decarboxylating) [Dethiosulfatibacter aminovorans DSM 17477]